MAIVQYKKQKYLVKVGEENTTIVDSYKIKNLSDMKAFIRWIKARFYPNFSINKRSTFSLVNEWRTHNLLYSLSIQKERTKSVDLNINQPWYAKVAYTILSPLYLHFR